MALATNLNTGAEVDLYDYIGNNGLDLSNDPTPEMRDAGFVEPFDTGHNSRWFSTRPRTSLDSDNVGFWVSHSPKTNHHIGAWRNAPHGDFHYAVTNEWPLMVARHAQFLLTGA